MAGLEKIFNKIRRQLAVIAGFLIVIMISYIVYSSFDAEDVELALGETVELGDIWTVYYQSGESEEISLPLTLSEDEKAVIIEGSIENDLAGLALSFSSDNAAIRVFIDGKPTYDEGFSEAGSNKDKWNRSIDKSDDGETEDAVTVDAGEVAGDEPDEAATEEETRASIFTQATEGSTTSTEAGDVVVDLPTNIDDEALVRIVLVQVDPDRAIAIHGASAAKRDVSVINMIRGSVLPLACGVIIIIAAAVMVTLDITRIISKRRTRGLIRLALLAVDMLLYSICETNILVIFFGNEYFFSVLEELCFGLIPLLLSWFFERGFKKHFPKKTTVLVWVNVIFTLVVSTIGIGVIQGKFSYIGDVTLVLALITIAAIMQMLFEYRRKSLGYNVIWMDIAGYACLTIALLVNPVSQASTFSASSTATTIKILSTTACFILLTAQHIHIVLFEYREDALAQANRLEEQMKNVEEKNELLKIAKAEAEVAKRDAIAANEAKGNFLANMSHEIRTPINAILGMDEMILRESGEKTIRSYASDIFSAGQTLLSLINDILDFSKIESGKMEIVPVDFDLSSMVNDLYNMISPRAATKELFMEVEVDENLPARLYGDDVRIRQIATNILTNAVKYTHEGGVWLRINEVKREYDYSTIRFEIKDTGIGIKKEDLPKLFSAYERIEESRNRNIEGTGLGLNITMELLSMMNSQMQVDSRYGEGSTFAFELRLRITDDTPIGNIVERIAESADNYEYSESFIAPDAHILVTDDNAMNRKVFISLLKQTKVQITEAAGGEEAIELVKKNHYDIIFMDHMMPKMDGVEAMHIIRSLPDNPCKDTPIYVLTANAVAGAKEDYIKEGFDGFLSKPIVSDKLEEVIRKELPEELMTTVKIEDSKEATSDRSHDEALDELPAVDGLDWYYAYLHLPDMELIEETVKEFYTLLSLQCDKLKGFYDMLPTDEGYNEYRIQVHGMKSSAATIGITPLAGMAKVLEFAARDKDEDTIRGMHDIFVREWESYSEKLKGVFGIGDEENSDKPVINSDTAKEITENILHAMEDFDVDMADELVGTLKAYSYDEAMAEKINRIKAAVADLDEDTVREIYESI